MKLASLSIDQRTRMAIVDPERRTGPERNHVNPPRFLKEGDVVECAIEGIGLIVNRVKRVIRTEKQASA
jgi:2-keto-4-pentenoate hydratase/2-oxohepta-3-ene-1,7-dioic acid hydratase in catechol pathway